MANSGVIALDIQPAVDAAQAAQAAAVRRLGGATLVRTQAAHNTLTWTTRYTRSGSGTIYFSLNHRDGGRGFARVTLTGNSPNPLVVMSVSCENDSGAQFGPVRYSAGVAVELRTSGSGIVEVEIDDMRD